MSNKPTTLEHLRSAMLRSEAFAGDVAAAAAAAIEELAGTKVDRGAWHEVELAIDAWTENTDAESLAAGYAFCCETALSDLTANDSAESILHFESMTAAGAAGLSPTSDVLDGKIRYYAAEIPAAAIKLQVRPLYGRTST